MLNTIYSAPDEKYSQTHVYIVFVYVSFGEEKKNENTANAAFKKSNKEVQITCNCKEQPNPI